MPSSPSNSYFCRNLKATIDEQRRRREQQQQQLPQNEPTPKSEYVANVDAPDGMPNLNRSASPYVHDNNTASESTNRLAVRSLEPTSDDPVVPQAESSCSQSVRKPRDSPAPPPPPPPPVPPAHSGRRHDKYTKKASDKDSQSSRSIRRKPIKESTKMLMKKRPVESLKAQKPSKDGHKSIAVKPPQSASAQSHRARVTTCVTPPLMPPQPQNGAQKKNRPPSRPKQPSRSRDSTPATPKSTGPVPKLRRQAVLCIVGKDLDSITREWEEAKNSTVPEKSSCRNFSLPKNASRNRYKDIPCLDSTRVILRGHTTDYIHANYVSTAGHPKRFICTQGPMRHTEGDFWHMVIQEKTKLIVQLCSYQEAGKPKCSKYFPETVGNLIHCEDIVIHCLSVSYFDKTEGVLLRSLKVTRIKDGNHQECIVEHLHWSSWPDHGIPRVSPLTSRILNKFATVQSPITIHCSAGVGRTGSVVALQMAIDLIDDHQTFHGFKPIVTLLRRQRCSCVQTPEQYLWVNRTLVDMWQDPNDASLHAKVMPFNKDYNLRHPQSTRPR